MKYKTLLNKSVANHAGSLLYKLFRYILLLGVSYVAIFPIIKMASASLSIAEDYYGGRTGILPSTPTFENFKNFNSYFKYVTHAKVTIINTVCGTVCSVFVCSLIGYGLGRYKFKGSNLVYAAVLFTIIMPVQTAQVPLTYYYRWFDFFSIGKIVGLFTGKNLTINLLPNVGRFVVPALFGVGLKAGIFIFLFRQFFAGLPRDMEEAAKLDGCSPLKTYWKVMMPNIKPVVVTVLLLSVIYYWNDSLVSGMAKFDMGTPLMVEIQKLTADTRGGYAYEQLTIIRRTVEYYAIMFSAVLPLTVIFIICQKFFVESMDRSGSKG